MEIELKDERQLAKFITTLRKFKIFNGKIEVDYMTSRDGFPVGMKLKYIKEWSQWDSKRNKERKVTVE